MHMGRITVPLDNWEATVLRQIAESDCRPPQNQIRFLLREEGRRRGLIDDSVIGLKNQAAQGGQNPENDQTKDHQQVLV